MDAIQRADDPVHAAIVRDCAHWGHIDVHLNGRVYTSGGHGFSALSRSALVTLMQQRAGGLGVGSTTNRRRRTRSSRQATT